MHQPFIIRVQYYRQFRQHQSSQKVLFPEGGRQLKHIGYLLVLDVCGESRTLQEQNRNISLDKTWCNYAVIIFTLAADQKPSYKPFYLQIILLLLNYSASLKYEPLS